MIADTLYAKFIDEREGAKILEHKCGFVTYKLEGDECFICNMFVALEFRQGGYARALVEGLEALALAAGCKILTGNIHLNDHGSNATLISSLLIGFQVAAANNGSLLIVKQVKGVT